MTKFLANCFLICIGTSLGILAMIHGWGVKPVSWGWIIGVGVLGQFAVLIVSTAINKD